MPLQVRRPTSVVTRLVTDWSQEPADGHGGRRTPPDAIMPLTCANVYLNGSARTAADPFVGVNVP